MINSKIGKYKIIRLIGEGGMAAVYEAEHEMLGTKVAIKILNPVLSANPQICERFREEARLMATLEHSNITKVIDFDETPARLFIVMEYLNGEDLKQKIQKNGPLTEEETINIFSQSLSAFQYAHEKGIVHRDIKPSNIFVLPNGKVKILDFGIAKLFGQGNELTQTGTQMGTPIYMSPEQVKADKSIDHRSDIYSLGVTMFFAVNGKAPYNSDSLSQFDIFNKIVFEALPILFESGNFNKLISKACEKNREDRYQSCKDWLNELNYIPTDKVISKEDVSEVVLKQEDKKNDYINEPELFRKKKNNAIPVLIPTGFLLFCFLFYWFFNGNKGSEGINDGEKTSDFENAINQADIKEILEKSQHWIKDSDETVFMIFFPDGKGVEQNSVNSENFEWKLENGILCVVYTYGNSLDSNELIRSEPDCGEIHMDSNGFTWIVDGQNKTFHIDSNQD
jgi:serine/threonine protein kinase